MDALQSHADDYPIRADLFKDKSRSQILPSRQYSQLAFHFVNKYFEFKNFWGTWRPLKTQLLAGS